MSGVASERSVASAFMHHEPANWPCRPPSETEQSPMSELGVYSEVGKLRKVLVHRPELSLQRLTPANHDELLFDDVLWVEQAQREHDAFVELMRGRGTEVFYVQDLLAETLATSDIARLKIIENVATPYTVGWSIVDEVRECLA